MVFVTEYRRRVLTGEHLDCLDASRQSVCEDFGRKLPGFEEDSDEAHLLVNFALKVSLARPVNSLKGACGRRLSKT